jgi:hypothetical protein
LRSADRSETCALVADRDALAMAALLFAPAGGQGGRFDWFFSDVQSQKIAA